MMTFTLNDMREKQILEKLNSRTETINNKFYLAMELADISIVKKEYAQAEEIYEISKKKFAPHKMFRVYLNKYLSAFYANKNINRTKEAINCVLEGLNVVRDDQTLQDLKPILLKQLLFVIKTFKNNDTLPQAISYEQILVYFNEYLNLDLSIFDRVSAFGDLSFISLIEYSNSKSKYLFLLDLKERERTLMEKAKEYHEQASILLEENRNNISAKNYDLLSIFLLFNKARLEETIDKLNPQILETYKSTLHLAKFRNNIPTQMAVYNNLGNFYDRNNQLDLAEECFQELINANCISSKLKINYNTLLRKKLIKINKQFVEDKIILYDKNQSKELPKYETKTKLLKMLQKEQVENLLNNNILKKLDNRYKKNVEVFVFNQKYQEAFNEIQEKIHFLNAVEINYKY